MAELDLAWGGDRWVDDAQMTSVPLGDPLSRGSAPFDRPIRLSVSAVAASPALGPNPLGAGGQIGVRIRGRRGGLGVAGAVHYSVGRVTGSRGALDTSTGFVSLGLFGQRHLRRLDLVAGAGVAGLRLEQRLSTEVEGRPWANGRAVQLTGAPYGEAGLHIPVGPSVGLSAGVRALVYPVRTDQIGFFVMGLGELGLEVRFGGRMRQKLPRAEH